MSSLAAHGASYLPARPVGEPLRVAFIGPDVWLANCAPPVSTHALSVSRFPLGPAGGQDVLEAIRAMRPHVCVAFDPPVLAPGILGELPGASLGILVDGAASASPETVGALDRLVSFDPALTGTQVGSMDVWRAVPPPVSDVLFSEPRRPHHAPRAVSIGRESAHREAMLTPVKHHQDMLQLIHGVSGAELAEVLSGYDVGIHVHRDGGGGFGQQVGVHLASGHLLLSEHLAPAHGLERGIDFLQVDSADGLLWTLERLGRFPEMYHRIRVRGRLKAEQYRASRLFGRLLGDLLADIAAFGPAQLARG